MGWLASRFELSRGDAANLRAMEGLRGFAVFLVFLVHFTTLVSPWVPEHSALEAAFLGLRAIGHSGVDLFFALSGYLIYGSLISRSSPYRSFMRRRVQRIYPTFIAVFLLYVVLSYVIPEESKFPESASPAAVWLLANFLLLPGIFPIRAMITVAWSLSYEMFYYLLTPIVIVACGLRARSPQVRIAFFLTAALVLVACCSVWGGPVRLIGFIGGIILFEVLQNRLWPAPSAAAGLACLAAGLAVMPIPTGDAGFGLKILFLDAGLFVLCFACLGRADSSLAALFSWTPMRWLGNMSYSYYLVHGVTLLGFFRLFQHVVSSAHPSALLCIALFPATFALTLIPAAALFLLIERRFSLKPAIRPQTGAGGARTAVATN